MALRSLKTRGIALLCNLHELVFRKFVDLRHDSGWLRLVDPALFPPVLVLVVLYFSIGALNPVAVALVEVAALVLTPAVVRSICSRFMREPLFVLVIVMHRSFGVSTSVGQEAVLLGQASRSWSKSCLYLGSQKWAITEGILRLE